MKPKVTKNAYTLFIVLILSVNSFCQDTTFYYGANHKPIASENGARFSKEVFIKNKKTRIIESYARAEEQWKLAQTERIKITSENNHTITLKPLSGNSYSIQRKFRELSNGQYEFSDYLEDKLLRIGNTSRKLPLCLQDTVKEFHKNGQIKTVAVYENNQLRSNKNWLKDGTKYYDNIFYAVDKEPEYISGQQRFNNFILANLNHRQVDLSHYAEKIVLGWVIDESGEIEGIHVAKSIYPGLSDLLVEIIEEIPSDWRPATLNGKEVNYYMQFPINFKNQEEEGFDSLELVDGFLHWD